MKDMRTEAELKEWRRIIEKIKDWNFHARYMRGQREQMKIVEMILS